MDKKIQVKRKVIGTEYVNGAGETVNERDENVYPVISSDHVIMEDGSKLTDKLLNINGEDYSEVITQEYAVDRVGGNNYKDQSKSGALTSMKLYGRTVVNELGDHGTSPITTNGNDVFAPNEGMNEKVRVIDGQMDELTIKGNSTYNIMPDRTCCTDDIEVSGDNTKAFSFKDGLDSRVMLDTGLSDKMVLKGNTLTNIVRDPIGYASVHEVQDNIVPGSSNIRVLKNALDNADYNNIFTAICSAETGNGITGGKWITVLYSGIYLKPSTKYTVILDVIENTLTREKPVKIELNNGDGSLYGTGYVDLPNNFTGRFVSVKTTAPIDSLTSKFCISIRDGNADGDKITIKNVMVIEGDCSDIAANLPYFKGTLSVNMENYDESRPKLVSGDCDRTKIYGQTLVDVLGSNRLSTEKTFTVGSSDTRYISFANSLNTIIKANTYYLLRFKVSNLNLDGATSLQLYATSGNNTITTDVFQVSDEYKKSINSNGIYYMKLKSNTEVPNASVFLKGWHTEWENSGSTARTLTVSEVSMYEYQEGMENWDLPYMVGEMRGTGLAKIESIVNGGEKELVDVLGETRNALSKTFTVNTAAERAFDVTSSGARDLKTNTDYILRFKLSNVNLVGIDSLNLIVSHMTESTRNVRITTNGIIAAKVTTLSDLSAESNKFTIKGLKTGWEESGATNRTLTISEISLYEYTPDMDNMELPYMLGTKRIGYYGERKRTYTLPSGLELRSLPNGVRDEFDFESGILTRRVGEVTLNGSESWILSTNFSSTYNSYYTIINDIYANSNAICNKYTIISTPDELGTKIGFYMGKGGTENKYAPFITSDKGNTDELKAYLASNPIKVQYELATPQYIDYSKDILEDGEYKVGERINGYQDGYNPTTGKYIKRIDKVILNGTQSARMESKIQDDDTCLRYYLSYNGILCKNDNEINIKTTDTRFKVTNRTAVINTTYYTFKSYIVIGRNGNYNSTITLNIPKSLLFENSYKGITDYLKRNPITLYYVLANEVESNMTQDEFNALTNRANPKLHYFKDGSLKCTCLSGQPKGQLRINTPTSNYYDMQLIKPDTQYTVNNFSNMYIDGNKYQTSSATPNQLTTPNTITSKKIVINASTDSIYPMMVEGVHDVNDIRFFGMKSSNVLMNTRGKNLFNKDAVIEGKYQNYNIDIQNFEISDVARYAITEYIPIKPNTTYINSGTSGGAYYDINKNVIKTDRIIGNQITFTTPSNARYIVLNSLDNASETPIWGDNPYIMEASESDTTYEPYAQPHEFKAFTKDENGVLQAVELNRINDDLCDEIDLSTGIITRRVGKIVLDGKDEDLLFWGSGIFEGSAWYVGNTIPFYTFGLENLLNANVNRLGEQKLPQAISNYLPYSIYRSNAVKEDSVLFNLSESESSGAKYDTIRLEKNNLICTSPITRDIIIATVNAYLEDNSLTIIYECEPYTEQAYIMIDGEFKTSLMLPNGVADGYNPITKVKTTRVGSKTYDGSYDGEYFLSAEREIVSEVSLGNLNDATNGNVYNHYSPQLVCTTSQIQMNRITMASQTVILTLPKEKIGTNKATLLQYLKDNPITVYYQKAEETTEPLDTFDTSTVVNNFPLANEYGYKVENTNEIKLSKVIHHLPTANMLYVPLLEPNTQYKIPTSQNFILDGNSLGHLNQIITTPSSINNKKLILIGKAFNPSIHSLIKYTGYTPNLSRLYQGYMRSDAISSSKNPKVSNCSKNLFNINGEIISANSSDNIIINNTSLTITSNWWAGQYVDLKPNTTYTLSYESATSENNFSLITVYSNDIQTGIGRSSTNSLTFTTPSNFKNIAVLFYAAYGENKNTVTYDKIQLELGNTATSYEPYKTPSVNEFRIQKAIPESSLTVGQLSHITGGEIESTETVRTDYIKVIPGLMYYLYNNANLRAFNVVTYDKDKAFLNHLENDGTCRMVFPSNVSYIRMTMSTTNIDNLVLKADLPLHRINANIYDEIDVKHNKLIRRVGRLTDLWKYNFLESINTNIGIPYFRLSNNLPDKIYDSGSANLVCNTLNASSSINNLYYVVKSIGYSFEFRVSPEIVTSEQFKDWFRANPTDILYELATPEVFNLTEYTDLANPLPNVYKDGTIQLDSSSETYPIIDYRTRSSNYFRSNLITNGYRYRLKASIATNPVAMISDKFNETEFDGDMIVTANNTSTDNYILFDTDKIDDVMLVHTAKSDNTLVYTSGLSSVKAPVIKCIGNNLFDGDMSKSIKYYDYYVKPLNLKPNTNYKLNIELTGSTSIMEGKYGLAIWAYGKRYFKRVQAAFIETNGNITIDSRLLNNSVFNTEDFDYKLAVYAGNSNVNIITKAILENYKVEIYEVGNDTTNLYKENVTRVLDAETKQEIELHSTRNCKDEIDLDTGIATIRHAKITITSMNQLSFGLDTNSPAGTDENGYTRDGKRIIFLMYTDEQTMPIKGVAGLYDENHWNNYDNNNITCNKLAGYSVFNIIQSTNSAYYNIGLNDNNHGRVFEIGLPTDKYKTLDDCKQWVKDNLPLEIVYNITPYTKEVIVLGNPIAYSQGNIRLESDGQIPTLEYKSVISTNQEVISTTNEINRQDTELQSLLSTLIPPSTSTTEDELEQS